MKTHIFILLLFCHFSSLAAEKQYESYADIVERLSSYRNSQVRTKMSTFVPDEKYHMSLGYSYGYVPMDFGKLTAINANGMAIGGAMPLLKQQLFAEGFAKFYESKSFDGYDTSMKQFDLRVTHKEPMHLAIFNFGIGTSFKYLSIDNNGSGESIRTTIPSLSFLMGLERHLTSRISLASDFLYHRSLRGSESGKNSYEAVLRLNYHL